MNDYVVRLKMLVDDSVTVEHSQLRADVVRDPASTLRRKASVPCKNLVQVWAAGAES
jgi:hypothetical protein